MDVFKLGSLMEALPFERNGAEFLHRANGIHWKIATDSMNNITATPFHTQNMDLKPFSFPAPPDFPPLGQREPHVGTWYLITAGNDAKYALAWLVCREIESDDKYMFVLISAEEVCSTVNANNLYHLGSTFAVRPLDKCIEITNAEPYSDPQLLIAKEIIVRSSREHLEKYRPSMFADPAQRQRQKKRENAELMERMMSAYRKTNLAARGEDPQVDRLASMELGKPEYRDRRFIHATRGVRHPEPDSDNEEDSEEEPL